MKDFFYSFYGKLSVVFLLLMLVLGAVQLMITYKTSMKLVSATDQQLNLHLADHIAQKLEPLLTHQASEETLDSNLHYLMVYNPRIEIYVLNNKGKIINFFANPSVVKATEVPLQPIKEFLNKTPRHLILGRDPRNPGMQKPFSVARVKLKDGKAGYLYIILSSQQYHSTLDRLQNSYIVRTSLKVLAIIFGLAAIAGLLIFGLLTRRLRRVTDNVEAFEEGDYSVRLDDDSHDEVGQLAGSFNRMADALQANVQELQQTDQLRRNLVANVSHDLRSPLASIQGYLETIKLKEKSISDQERQHYLDIISNNTRLLRNLVQQLFELSKFDARQVEPDMEAFSIAELVQDVIIKLRPKANDKQISLSANLLNNLPQVWADIGLIERVITNLLENAISYTEPQGKVEVSLKQRDNFITIEITDNGPGISKEDLPHIFDRFHRGDKSRSLARGNTGLGLAIARKILDLHHTDFRVESEAGVGTQFSFDLPFYHARKG